MSDMDKAITDFVNYCNGTITEEEYTTGERQYKMTKQDIKEMQNNADRELFGSGSAY